MAQRITQKLINELMPPANGQKIIFDDELRGFGIRITATGAIAFIMDYRTGGRQRRMTIGPYPDLKPQGARERAGIIRRVILDGGDPMRDRHNARTAPTIADLWARYAERHLPKKRSAANDISLATRHVLPNLGKMKVTDVKHLDIDKLHRKISVSTPVQANRVMSLIHKMFELAIVWELRADNPAKRITRNPEEARQRYLKQDEIQRLSAILMDHPNQQSSNAIRLILLTGARKGEVLSAKWREFDLAVGTWTKPSAHTKQKKEHRIPLSAATRQLLSAMQIGSESEFLFPGPAPETHQVDIKRFWQSVRKNAEIEDCRIHDLRHTYASILASAGQSLPIVGALLGHTQPQTTARYTHLYDDPLRAATERVGAIVSGDPGTPAEVISINRE